MGFASGAGVASKLFFLALAFTACGSSKSPAGESGGDSSSDPGAGGSSSGGKTSTAHGGRPSSSSAGAGSSNDDAGSGPIAEATPSGLWYGGVSLCGFAHEQLAASSDNNPQVIVPLADVSAVTDVAFDANGNAWVVGTGSDSVFRFSAASLAEPTSAKPDLELSSADLSDPGNLTFDSNGSLWVATRPPMKNGRVEPGSVLRFSIPDDASGKLSLSAAAQISSTTEDDLDLIGNITFDSDHNLWLSSLVGLLRFDNPLKKKGTLALDPGAVIDKSGYDDNQYFYSIAFDSSGALWAASGDGLHYLTSVTEFADPGSLEGRSSPDVTAKIMGPADLLPAGGIAFDATGNLWMARGNGLVMYSDPGSLSGTVSPDADLTIDVKGDAVPSTNSHLSFAPLPSANAPTTR